MAINKIFGGANLYIPGAYDTKNVVLTNASPSVAVGKVAIFGEAEKGEPSVVKQFSPEALRDLIAEYGSGPIVDAARALVIPSNDRRITNGASAIYIYKTNPSTKASLTLATGFGSMKSLEYGKKANLIYTTITKSNAVNATVVSSATFDSTTAIPAATTFSIRVGGGAANVFTAPAGIVSRATLQTQLNTVGNWSLGLPVGITFTVGGVADATATLTVSMDALSTDHQLGASRVFELFGTNLSVFNISSGVKVPAQEEKVSVQVVRQSDGIVEDSDNTTGDIGGKIYLEIGCVDTTCAISINATKLTSVADTKEDLDITLSDFATINDLAAFINAKSGYKASVPAAVNGSLPPTILDRVSSIGAAVSVSGRKACKIKADSYEMYDYIRKNSALVEIINTSFVGLPDEVEKSFLSGAVRGASSSAEFLAALDEFESVEDIDIMVPLVSQDASDDKAEDEAYTDSASSYEVASIHVATINHCKKMSGTKARKERQCYLGFRGIFEDCKIQALSLGSEFASMLIEDVSVLGADGNLAFKQPHISASICAGMQAGADIGQPTTKKSINAFAIRHVGKQGITLTGSDKFSVGSKGDEAIQAGILPLRAATSGGIEIVVQNTTYSKDSNFVYNRPSVISAMNFISKSLRSSIENNFIGEKNRGLVTASSIKSFVESVMADFHRADLIVGDDSNDNLGYKNLVVSVDGSTVYVDITVTPVQGIDFVLTTISIDNIRINR